MRILHLVLYNQDTPHERAMYAMTRMLYDSYAPIITTVYYTYGPVEQITLNARTHVLQIPGTESFVPGILDKTWAALQWAVQLGAHFDYVVRSNISTVINFDNLEDALRKQPVEYGGCHVLTLAWLDEAGGIVDPALMGTRFASGTCIIWSNACLLRLVHASANVLDRSIIDDVALGLAMQRVGVPPVGFNDRFYFYSASPFRTWHPDCIHRVDGVPDAHVEAELQTYGPRAIAFRHKTGDSQDRCSDLALLARTVRYILKWTRRLI